MKDGYNESDLMRRMYELKPRLKDLDGFTNEVMDRIGENNYRHQSVNLTKLILKYAAVFFVVIGISNYAWQEVDTWQQRDMMLANSKHEKHISVSESRCSRQISFFLKKVSTSAAFIHPDKIVLQRNEMLKMIPVKSPYWIEMQMFLKALEKYYPRDYESYRDKGEMVLSVRKLKEDERLCEVFDKAKE